MTKRSCIPLLLVVALLPGCWLMGDSFFRVRGRVATCGATPAPLPEVRISADRVVSGGTRPYDGDTTTDAAGAFDTELAVSHDATMILKFAKSGFESKELTLVGAPKTSLAVCLNPSAAASSSNSSMK
jgi:hypothetical protein